MAKARAHKSDSCEGFLTSNDGLINSDRLRQMLGLAVKYVLPEKDWDNKGPVALRAFRRVTFDSNPLVRPMVEAFSSRSAEQMRGKNALNNCLKWLVGYNDGLSSPRCKIKTRKKRLTRVAKEFKRRLRDRNLYDRTSGQGVTIFVLSVKRQFLGRGRDE